MPEHATRPQVRYATAADGVRIAYTAVGAGPAILQMAPLPLRHVELEWTLPEDRRFMERLGRGRTVVGYDPRGFGLSERVAAATDLDTACLDLDAVVDAVSVERIALFAAVNTGPIAIAYAARHPDRVSHLVLWCTSARAADVVTPQIDILIELLERDPELASEAAARVLVGWSAGDAAERYARFIRAAATVGGARAFLAARAAFDATTLLGRVAAPTLVLHRRDVTWISLERATELAAGIPGARLVILEGASMRPASGDLDAAIRAVDDFVPADEGIDATAPDAPVVASAPQTHGDAADRRVFRREGDYWTVTFAGTTSRLRDAKGLRHIAHLLREPGRAVPATELAVENEPDAATGVPTDDDATRVSGSLGDAGAILDDRAKREYRRRLGDLRTELADAERCNDAGRATAARAELETLASALAAATGLGGRDRKAGSSAERARLTVTKRIKDTLARIGEHHPALGEHLRRAIRTGALCSYAPAADDTAPWEL